MIEINELHVLKEAVEIVKAKLMIDREVLTEDEIASMTKTIRDLNWMISDRQRKTYVEQLTTFYDHMEDTISKSLMDNGELCEKFCNMGFTITFNEKSVKLDNGAEVFDAIYDLVKSEIDEHK